MDTRQWMSVLLCLATALMLFVACLSYWKRQQPMARTMMWMMVTASCYSMGYTLEIVSESLREVKLSYQLEYAGIPFVSAFWLLLVFQFTGFAARHRRPVAIGIFLIPTITFLLHLTNDWHHLIYRAYLPNADGLVPVFNTVKGPWYGVHAVYNYTILLFGILLFLPMYLRAVPIVRKQIVVLIVGAAGPILFNIAYMFNKEIDFTPLGFALSGLVYAWGIFRFRLLRLTPLAYAKMFDTIRDGAILLDYDNLIVSHNEAATESYPGLNAASDGPVSARTLFAESPELLDKLTSSQRLDERFPLARALGDRMRHYICSITHIYDTGTSPIGKMILLSDVTALRENEERLREKSERLTQLNAFKDKLFTVMAHDIRDPIALLVSLTEILEEEPEEPADPGRTRTKAEVLPEIKRQVRGTYRLVDNLLDWYRSQNGKIAFRPQPWNLQQVVRQALSLAGARAAAKHIRVTERIDDQLTVNADKEMLDLILRNLLANAIKYTDVGGQIAVSASVHDGEVRVSVSDDGRGIDEETAKLLRRDEMYFKEPGFASSDDGGEMRFGLVLTREFLRMHGGSLRFESEAGRGTTFWFTLPGCAGGGAAADNDGLAVRTYESDAG